MLAVSGMFKKLFADLAEHVPRGSKDSANEISVLMPPRRCDATTHFQEQTTCVARNPYVGKHTPRVSTLRGNVMLNGHLCRRITATVDMKLSELSAYCNSCPCRSFSVPLQTRVVDLRKAWHRILEPVQRQGLCAW